MSFWENVDKELNYSGKTRKELAKEVGFPDSYISKGIARKSIPSADLALKISHALNVSLENLLEIPKKDTTQEDFSIYKKYATLINNIEQLSLEKQEFLKIITKELIKV